tara:strand:+ start:878 stop:1957 length:1080 start_codon:yes stop_codon:yes gene_type:complete
MSSNTYTLKIDIDDSKIRDLEKRIMAIMGMNGTQRSGLGDKMTDASKGGDKNSIGKNIAKLGIIAIGVGSLVGLVAKISGMIVDSSPMLSQMLKLLNFGIMLVLRPIGDFIGFFLRPMVIFFIRSIALPWYRSNAKKFQEAGTRTAMSVIDNPGGWLALLLFGSVATPLLKLDEIQNAIIAAGLKFKLWVQTEILDKLPKLPDLPEITFPTIDFTSIKTWFDNLFSLDNLPTFSWSAIKTFLDKFSLEKLPAFNWTYLKEFLKLFQILKVPTFSWTGLDTAIELLKTEVKKTIDSITAVFAWIIAKLAEAWDVLTTLGGGGDVVQQIYVDITSNLDDAHNDIKEKGILGWMQDEFTGNG